MSRGRETQTSSAAYDALSEALLATHRAKQGRGAALERSPPSPARPAVGGAAGYDRARGLMMRLEQVVSEGHGTADEFASAVRRESDALNSPRTKAPVIRSQARRGTHARAYLRLTNHESTPSVIEVSCQAFRHCGSAATLAASVEPGSASLECGESAEICVSADLSGSTATGTYLAELTTSDEASVVVFELRVYD